MPRFVYKITNGRASDLRFVAASYVLQAGETQGNADSLPINIVSQSLARVQVSKSAVLSRITDKQLAAMTDRQKLSLAVATDAEVTALLEDIGVDSATVLAP